MPFIAIILDIAAVAGFLFQDSSRTQSAFIAGTILQAILTVILLILVFAYSGQRKQRHTYGKGYRYLTVRFGIIFMSFVFNALVLFAYVVNVSYGNSFLFQ